ncbi:MAG: hypothetical protein DDT21_02430 [Syntrophomonadaceae bacterium]|nr:hypothetical protein [Bacillota bacterium]
MTRRRAPTADTWVTLHDWPWAARYVVRRGEAIERVCAVLAAVGRSGRSIVGELSDDELAEIIPLLNGLGLFVAPDLWHRGLIRIYAGYLPSWVAPPPAPTR